ncbi:hypothetical protein H9P43_000408 [Blastocladiella emersonii ATCC 22665]|nr:hypothetical protein H9P43_000408 [Blastocladiella emersonii ATCC 22665]
MDMFGSSAPAAPAAAARPASFGFDEARLRNEPSQERQELMAFQWLSRLVADLDTAPADLVKADQTAIERKLGTLLTPGTAPFRPSRALRRLVAGCYLTLFTRGESRRAFDLIVALQTQLNTTHKVSRDQESLLGAVRMLCLGVLGRLTERFGSNFLSVFSETVHVFFKYLKPSVDAGIRLEALDAFSRAIRGAARGMSDLQAKEALKVFRAGLSDKLMAVRQASAECIACMARSASLGLVTVPDYEAFLYPLFRAFEGTNYDARIAIARAIANVLAPTQNTFVAPVAPVKTSKKKKDKDKDQEQEAAAPQLEEKTLLTCAEMLGLLHTSLLKYHARESRIGVAEAYVFLLQMLGPTFIETQYPAIALHFNDEILNSPKFLTLPLPEIVSVKEILIHVLRSLGQSMTETGQINAIKHLMERYVTRWPQLPETPCPNKWALSVFLAEIAGLLDDVNGVAATLPESTPDALIKIAGHPSHLVQTAAAVAIMRLGLNSPTTLAPMFTQLHGTLYREMPTVTGAALPEAMRRYIGYSLAVAGLLAVIPKAPLYAPSGAATHVFTLAANLLRAPPRDVRVNLVVNEVAWNLLTGLMAVGSSAVKAQLSQCLLLWKDAFPKSPGSTADMYELLHAKEAALKALSALLIHNDDILNADLRKRVAVLVTNVVQLLLTHPALASPSAAPMPLTTKVGPLTVSYGELDSLFRKRLFDCIAMLPPVQFESLHGQLVKAAGDIFAQDPADARRFDVGQQYQVYHAFEKQAMPVNAPFGPLFWQSAEYGAHTLPVDGHIDLLSKHSCFRDPGFTVAVPEPLFDYEKWAQFERHLFHPVQGALEYDTVTILQAAVHRPRPSPPQFALVNSAIAMYGLLFPYVLAASQEAYLDTYARILKQKQERPGKRVALLVNVLQAMHLATGQMMALNGAAHAKRFTLTPQSTKSLLEVAMAGNGCTDGGVRLVSAHVTGKIAELAAGNAAMASISQFLVSQIVENRDPDIRAGGAMALVMTHVHTQSGAAIKTTVGVLHTLCADTHAGVAAWATLALAHLMEARGAQVYPLVTPTLSVICRQLMAESRPQFVARVLFGCVDTLGPELQVSDKLRDLIVQFTEYLLEWESLEECAEAWRTVTHLLLMAPGTFPVPRYAGVLQALLGSDHTTLRRAVLQCLCSMVQRSPETVLANTDALERTLVLLARAEPDLVRKSLASLVESGAGPSRWIDLCRTLLNPSTAGTAGAAGTMVAGAGGLGAASGSDTEDEGDDVAVASLKPSERKRAAVQWTSQLAALQSLRQLITFLAQGADCDWHLDLSRARARGGEWLVNRIGDVIRVAFTASTALTQQVRREGLGLLEDVLDHFAAAEDPDFAGHRLLEQYQAQFSSALTPAFTSDAYPEIVATASHVCARYISAGITEDLFTLSRIIKLLTQALTMVQSAATGATSGSQHAQIMIALAVLGAWAELRRAASTVPALASVVDPQIGVLLPLWLTCLFEYSIVKQDADTAGMLPTKLEGISPNVGYAMSSREVVLPMYTGCWVPILSAVTILVSTPDAAPHIAKYGTVATPLGTFPKMFMVLFGLAFEPLVSVRASEATTLACVDALMALVTPQHMHTLAPAFAKELLTMADRLMQTESPAVQARVVALIDALITRYHGDLDKDTAYHASRVLFRAVVPVLPQLLEDPSAAVIFGDVTVETTTIAASALIALGNAAAKNPAWVPLTLHLYAAALAAPALRLVASRLTVLIKGIFDASANATAAGAAPTAADEDRHELVVSLVAGLLSHVEANLVVGGDPEIAKQCLLAATVCMTSGLPSDGLMRLCARSTATIVQCLTSPELTHIALQCARSLLQLAKRPDARDFGDACIRYLLPHLVTLTFADPPALTPAALAECAATVALAGALSSPTDPRPATLVASALVGVLSRFHAAHPWAGHLRPAAVQGVTALAATHPDAFRTVVAGLAPAARAALEDALRASVGTAAPGAGAGGAGAGAASAAVRHDKPSIQLKMSF